VEVLTDEQCRALLQAGLIGRVAFWADGPRIMPVNFAVIDDAIVVRTSPDSELATRGVGTEVAVEIDHVDYQARRGWSVVATGPCEWITEASEIATVRDTWDPRPWANGTRDEFLRIRWHSLTGRRIGGGWTYDNEVPVRRRV